ncbi:MAG: endonuclease III [Nanoarchaeota archaeon]|nr:endonuclease III [Nanoarchaeota archaeon]
MNSKLAVRQLKALDKLNKKKKGVVEMRLAAQWPQKYQMLIATILSAQTRDEVTIEACDVLFERYPRMIDLSKATEYSVRKIISRVNYAPTKASRIIRTAKMIGSGRIPTSLEGLMKFPGVGRKVGNVYLTEAHRANAIGVDTHVHRISWKLGWTESRYPDKVENDLVKLFPLEHWQWINEICVRFGKSYGLSRKNENEIFMGKPFCVSKDRLVGWNN